MKKKRTTIFIEESAYETLKKISIKTGISITFMINKAVQDYIKRGNK